MPGKSPYGVKKRSIGKHSTLEVYVFFRKAAALIVANDIDGGIVKLISVKDDLLKLV